MILDKGGENMENHFENYSIKKLGWKKKKKVQDMKVFVSEKNDSKYETAVCPDCASPEDSNEGINMK